MIEISTSSADETRALAARIAAHAREGWVVALAGELGAGKTTFVKGFAAALGVNSDDVTSPTFTLVHQYRGRVLVNHLDLYRLEAKRELDDLGIEELFEQGVTLVEWAKKIPGAVPEPRLEVTLEIIDASTPSRRRIRVDAMGSGFEDLMKDLSQWR